MQSVGLLARALEEAGIATTMTSWMAGRMGAIKPPRATLTQLGAGMTLGHPGDAAQQRRVIQATLDLLAQPAPVPVVRIDER